jgi:hypothetical protein
MKDSPSVMIRPAKTPGVVLECGKCRRKLGADGKAIRKALKRALKSRRWGKVRLVETRCFALCPKGRQVLASARSLSDGRLLVVQKNSSLEETLTYLLGPGDGEADPRHLAERGLAPSNAVASRSGVATSG